MKQLFARMALECLFDLGITVVYAVFVGILIVAIVASDDGPISVLRAGIYATILPAGALALIVAEVALRGFKEWSEARRTGSFPLRRIKAARLTA